MTHYASPVVASVATFVFFYGLTIPAETRHLRAQSTRMTAAVLIVVGSYLLIGTFTGFSLLLGLDLLVALYGIVDHRLGASRVVVTKDGGIAP